ncbi:hypothetical protein MMC27_004126 [Xylographa pallens]|nr:hypothetical protein [Xylographa pallens]
MRSVIAISAALVAGTSAQWNGTTAYTTEVVTAYTTYCPAATSIVHGNQTYRVTEATTLTITNCPCTVTKPVPASTIAPCTTWYYYPSAPLPPLKLTLFSSAVLTSAAAIPITTSPASGPTYANSSAAAAIPPTSVASVGLSTAGAPTASSTPFKGAADKVVAASGLGVAGVLGLAAYFL